MADLSSANEIVQICGLYLLYSNGSQQVVATEDGQTLVTYVQHAKAVWERDILTSRNKYIMYRTYWDENVHKKSS